MSSTQNTKNLKGRASKGDLLNTNSYQYGIIKPEKSSTRNKMGPSHVITQPQANHVSQFGGFKDVKEKSLEPRTEINKRLLDNLKSNTQTDNRKKVISMAGQSGHASYSNLYKPLTQKIGGIGGNLTQNSSLSSSQANLFPKETPRSLSEDKFITSSTTHLLKNSSSNFHQGAVFQSQPSYSGLVSPSPYQSNKPPENSKPNGLIVSRSLSNFNNPQMTIQSQQSQQIRKDASLFESKPTSQNAQISQPLSLWHSQSVAQLHYKPSSSQNSSRQPVVQTSLDGLLSKDLVQRSQVGTALQSMRQSSKQPIVKTISGVQHSSQNHPASNQAAPSGFETSKTYFDSQLQQKIVISSKPTSSYFKINGGNSSDAFLKYY